MSSNSANMRALRNGLQLNFPQSLGVYDEYADAQKAVDYLSDNGFPVENCMIVGTDLKQVERVTGRLTTGRVALGGLLSGVWLGLFVGLVFSLFGPGSAVSIIASTAVFGALFGVIWALAGYAATRGRRDFSSVSQIVATRYEVLVEHKYAAQGRELLAKMPGNKATDNPFA
ncbi:MAG TPA: general stress protein [Nocardioides sp.]|nr:general stress protein [uncultured Nocardioides sp.]HEX5984885.1 general stress protein [Nocardioides sp.]